MTLEDKISKIFDTVHEIKQENPEIGSILFDGFALSLNLIEEIAKKGRKPELDVSEHLEIITNVLGVSLRDLVISIINTSQESTKAPDQDTLDFITSDLDDYEKFLAQNKAKGDLDFLSKEI